METWKPAPGFNTWYEVSDHGRVRRARPGKSTFVGKILQPTTRKSGHQTVYLRMEGKDRQVEVHRLVAAAFIGPCPEKKEVNHIDGRPANNVVGNLEYVTRSENVLHAYRLGLIKPRRGERVSGSKLIARDIRMIRNSPLGTAALALHYKVSAMTIKSIRARQTWRHVD